MMQMLSERHEMGEKVPGAFTNAMVLVGNKVIHGEVWRLVTCGFLHSTDSNNGIFHILFNMLFLWLVGRELEERHGGREFLAFYLVALVVSSLAFMGWASLKLANTSMDSPCMGASGAVTAALVLFIFHAPHRRILFFFVIPMPIWVLGVMWVGFDFLALVSPDAAKSDTGHRVAFAAHLGGAAFGALYFLGKLRITA